MDITTGFLGTNTVFAATIPDELGVSQEACTVVQFRGLPRTVQWADSLTGDRLVTEAGLYPVSERRGPGSQVSVYGQNDPFTGQPFARVLMFAPTREAQRFGRLWVTLENEFDGDAAEDAFVQHLRPELDAAGIPRFSVRGPLRLASGLDPVQQEIVTFFGARALENVEAVRFTNAGALSADRKLTASAANSITVGTAPGISVTCDGGDGMTSTLGARAADVAATVRTV